jgi:5-methylcytosine-specific restriction endonuclease McrA
MQNDVGSNPIDQPIMTKKYTKELLEPIVFDSNSYSEVIKKLGLKQGGGTQTHIKKIITFFEIDTSHFYNKRYKNITSHNRKEPESILIDRSDDDIDKIQYRSKPYQLKRAMIESGIGYFCVMCKQDDNWKGNKLILDIDHIDGNWLNNKIENVRFLCPNCHSQVSRKLL